MISANSLLGKDGHSVHDQWTYRGLRDCGKDWHLELVLLFLFESDSSRQMHWIASVSCALYHGLISVCMREVWVTNHHLLWRSCAFPWKRLNLQNPAAETINCLPLMWVMSPQHWEGALVLLPSSKALYATRGSKEPRSRFLVSVSQVDSAHLMEEVILGGNNMEINVY